MPVFEPIVTAELLLVTFCHGLHLAAQQFELSGPQTKSFAECICELPDQSPLRAFMPRVIAIAKDGKRRYPRAKYRNMEIVEAGVKLQWHSLGPMM